MMSFTPDGGHPKPMALDDRWFLAVRSPEAGAAMQDRHLLRYLSIFLFDPVLGRHGNRGSVGTGSRSPLCRCFLYEIPFVFVLPIFGICNRHERWGARNRSGEDSARALLWERSGLWKQPGRTSWPRS